jgi:hypothetical protein
MSDDPIPGNDSSEAYEVIPMPEHWRGPRGWRTVMRDGIPVRHFPKRAGARRYATDPAYRASLTEKKFWQDRDWCIDRTDDAENTAVALLPQAVGQGRIGPLEWWLIKCNADPACLPPNDVTMVVTMLGFNDKIKWTGDADLAFDFKIRTADWHVTDQTVDTRSAEQDCSGLHDNLALGISLAVHHNRAVPSIQNLIRSVALD